MELFSPSSKHITCFGSFRLNVNCCNWTINSRSFWNVFIFLKFQLFHKLCCTKQNKQHKIKNSAICTYEQCLPSGYTENGKNQEFKSTKTSQTHCFGKLKRLASSTVLVYQNSSFSTVLALQKGGKFTVKILI